MTKDKIDAMAFFHPHGLNPAWKLASLFAGDAGKLATLPDIIKGRLLDAPDRPSWSSYFTTLTAEYYGLSRSGIPVLAVAHGIGPLSTIEGCTAAYAKVGERQRGIDAATFHRLLDGAWGEVHLIDWKAYTQRRGRLMGTYLTLENALFDEWTLARLGGASIADAYLERHAAIAAEYAAKHNGEHILRQGKLGIIQQGDSYQRPYTFLMPEGNDYQYVPAPLKNPDAVVAHLLSIGQLCNSQVSGSAHSVLTSDISPHDWSDNVRLAAIRSENASIHQGFDVWRALEDQNAKLWVENTELPSFDLIVGAGDNQFTAYPKVGEVMDNWLPMCQITSMEEIGEPTEFSTDIGGYHAFFKYGLAEVRRIAPPGANAYEVIGNPQVVGNRHVVSMQFYKIEADRSRRLMRPEEIYRNPDLVIELAESQSR